MRQDERTPFVDALQAARLEAYPEGEFVEQESFMRASEILQIGQQAGLGPGLVVLDLCCGVAGPGRYLTRQFGCDYLGLDYSASALDIARQRSLGLNCRFELAHIPPLPEGKFEVILLLETLLAFADKANLFAQVGERLQPGGRFAFTLEEGHPLSPREQEVMPDSDTVWLTPLDEIETLLRQSGLALVWQQNATGPHLQMVSLLVDSFERHRSRIASQIGGQALEELLQAHRLWQDWMGSGRVRKFALVAEKVGSP
jgi:sarcosine/dimethylglycine N-methyltransferase